NSARTGDKVTRPWIGASFQNVTSDIAESLGMQRPRGALVVAVSSGSPADDAELKIGDVVLRVNDRAVNHPDALGYRLDTLGVGNKATVHVLTRGERRQIQIALIAPPEDPPRDIRDMPEGSPLWGAQVANVSPALTQEYSIANVEDGVVVLRIAASSPASFNGLRPRDVVREVNGTEIESTRHLQRIVSKDAHSWQFVVERGGEYLIFERRGGFLRQYRR
ncbi:MAG: PDZ domain-containing protein, partial [Pseudomonadota bacterium]